MAEEDFPKWNEILSPARPPERGDNNGTSFCVCRVKKGMSIFLKGRKKLKLTFKKEVMIIYMSKKGNDIY